MQLSNQQLEKYIHKFGFVLHLRPSIAPSGVTYRTDGGPESRVIV